MTARSKWLGGLAAIVLVGVTAGVVAASRSSTEAAFRATEVQCQPGESSGVLISDPKVESGVATARAALREHLRTTHADVPERAFETAFQSADHVEFVYQVDGRARYVAQASANQDGRWVVRRSESCS
jgi:hypothetical protein